MAKKDIESTTSFEKIKSLVNEVQFDKVERHIKEMLNEKNNRITEHKTKDPTIWKGNHYDWVEEVWTKAVDIFYEDYRDSNFVDSEVPLLNDGDADIVFRYAKVKKIEIYELKRVKGGPRKALREVIFYSLALFKYFRKDTINYGIHCGIILVPEKNEKECNISKRMKKNLIRDIDNFNKELKDDKYPIKILEPRKIEYTGNKLPKLKNNQKVIDKEDHKYIIIDRL